MRGEVGHMALIYLSTDELNRSLARGWGEESAIEVECPDPIDGAWHAPCHALLIDLDHATCEWLAMLATWRKSARAGFPIAVHGYGTAGDAFRDRGVTVRSRLRPELLRDLARDACAPAPEPVEEEADSLTWVELV